MNNIRGKFKLGFNKILSIFLLLGVTFSIITIVFATAPDPGHNFTESSGGLILGDLIYGSGADTALSLAGNITATKKFLNQTGNGSVSAAPVWSILGTGDIPDLSGTYSVKAGNTSLVTVGTIGTGTWNADAIADGKIASALTGKTYNALTLTAAGTGFTIAGGTVSKTLTVTGDATISGTPLTDPMTTIGDIIIRNGSNVTARLAGAAGFLKGNVSTAPAWSTINLAASADVGTSILPTANGGTGIAYFTAAGPTAARVYTFPDAAATVLTDNTDVTVAQGGTGLSTLTANNVILGNGASAPLFVAPGTSGNVLTSNGATWASAAPVVRTVYNQSVSTPGAGFAADTYLVGSSVAIPATGLRAGTRYYLIFQVSKTAAGLATPILNVRFGTGGTTSDTSRCALTFTAQTAATDTGTFEIWATFRTVGSGTSAVLQCAGQRRHGASITGLGTLVSETQVATSGGFDSTVANSIVGTSVNGGASAAWTITLVQAELTNLP